MKCLYKDCVEVPSCRQENPDYSPCGDHYTVKGECTDYLTDHKWICDKHWDLLEFLRVSGVLDLEVKVKQRSKYRW